MNCHECQDLVQQRLDGEAIAEGPALAQHLSQCPSCREQHAAAVHLLAGLPQLPRPTLPSNFAQRVVGEVLHDRRRRQERMRRQVFVTAALAASVMLMLAAAFYWLPHQQGPKTHEEAKKEEPKKIVAPSPEKPAEQPPPLTAWDRVADATRDHAKVVIAAANLDAVEKLPMNDLPVLDPGLRGAGQEVSDGVRAVTLNTRKALSFFAREFPMPEVKD